MAKQGNFITEYILAFAPDKRGLPKYRQLYLSLRNAILGGVLQPGEPLPSSRTLAGDLACSRNTVVAAIEQLLAEGYLETRRGSGTFVAANIPAKGSSPKRPPENVILPKQRLSGRTQQLISLSQRIPPYGGGVLAPGLPDLESFPNAQWTRIYNKHSRQIERKLTDFGYGGGYMPLRRAVADYLRRARMVNCEDEQVFITCGTTQSIHLLTVLLTNPGETAWIEEPGYTVAQGMLQAADLNVQPIAVDRDGITIPQNLPAPRVIYTTPSYQFPMGISMPLARRLVLLDFCERNEAWIIEDDYDGEFRFGTQPVASLQGLNANNRTVYLGTFSKILTTTLRVSYMVVPPQMVDTLAKIYQILGNESSIITQAALEEFIALGYFESHIRRMRKIYGERREAMQHFLLERAGLDITKIGGINGGLHMTVGLADNKGTDSNADDDKVVKLANRQAMGCRALSHYFIGKPHWRGLMLGYTSCAEKPLCEALDRLYRIIEKNNLYLKPINI